MIKKAQIDDMLVLINEVLSHYDDPRKMSESQMITLAINILRDAYYDAGTARKVLAKRRTTQIGGK